MARRIRAGNGGIVKPERQAIKSSMQETAAVRDQSVSSPMSRRSGPVRPLGRELAAEGPGGSGNGKGRSSQAERPDALFPTSWMSGGRASVSRLQAPRSQGLYQWTGEGQVGWTLLQPHELGSGSGFACDWGRGEDRCGWWTTRTRRGGAGKSRGR